MHGDYFGDLARHALDCTTCPRCPLEGHGRHLLDHFDGDRWACRWNGNLVAPVATVTTVTGSGAAETWTDVR